MYLFVWSGIQISKWIHLRLQFSLKSCMLQSRNVLWLLKRCVVNFQHFSHCVSFAFLGKFNAKWLSGDFSICWGSRRHQGSCQQRGLASYGKRRQSAPQTGAGKPHGRVEIFNLFWLLSLSTIKGVRVEAWSANWNKEPTIQKKKKASPPRTWPDLPIIPATQTDCRNRRRRALLSATLCSDSWQILGKPAARISFRWQWSLREMKLSTWAICTCDCKVNFGFYCWDHWLSSLLLFPLS